MRAAGFHIIQMETAKFVREQTFLKIGQSGYISFVAQEYARAHRRKLRCSHTHPQFVLIVLHLSPYK